LLTISMVNALVRGAKPLPVQFCGDFAEMLHEREIRISVCPRPVEVDVRSGAEVRGPERHGTKLGRGWG
jgi:hypothetical protein